MAFVAAAAYPLYLFTRGVYEGRKFVVVNGRQPNDLETMVIARKIAPWA